MEDQKKREPPRPSKGTWISEDQLKHGFLAFDSHIPHKGIFKYHDSGHVQTTGVGSLVEIGEGPSGGHLASQN